jgi:hypothetical protein
MTKTLISEEPRFIVAPSVKPFPWASVTGRDFGRANAWARRHPNTLSQQIRARLCLPARLK